MGTQTLIEADKKDDADKTQGTKRKFEGDLSPEPETSDCEESSSENFVVTANESALRKKKKRSGRPRNGGTCIGNSGLRMPSYKRPPDTQQAPKRPNSSTNDAPEKPAKVSKLEEYVNKTKMPSREGIKLAEHGNIFQLKLLMLCLWRAAHKFGKFRLATEMPEAEKFDDVVFQYQEKNSDKWKSRLIQAKSKENENTSDSLKKITLGELLSTDDKDFSLQKYFHSDLKIQQRSRENSIYSVFSDSEIEDVIVITNTDFNSENERSVFGDPESIEADALFKTDKADKIVYKIKDIETINRCKIVFENSSDFYKLTELLTDRILNNKKMDNTKDKSKKDVFQEYRYPLSNEILQIDDEGKGKAKKYFIFRDNFLKGEALSDGAINVRYALIKEIAFRNGSVKIPEIDESFGNKELPNDEKELNKLAKKVAEFIQQEKQFTVNDYEQYHVALARKVIDIKSGKLRSELVKVPSKTDKNELLTLSGFKKYLISALSSQTAKKAEDIKKYLGTIKIDLSKIHKDFGIAQLSSDETKLKELARKLGEFIKENKKLSVKDFQYDHVVLANEIIDIQTQKFHEIFINGQQKINDKVKVLSPEAKKFRRLLLDEIESHDIQIIINDQQMTFKKLNEDTSLAINLLSSSRIEVSEGFAKASALKDDKKIENIDLFAEQMKHLINNTIQDNEHRVIEINDKIKTKLNIANGADLKTFNDNIKKLAGYVLINRFDKVRFSTGFLNMKSNTLPDNIVDFRAKFKELLGDESFELLYEYEFKFDKPFHTWEDGELYRRLPVVHSDSDVANFFSKLKFIVNYPNRREINDLLGAEIKDKFKTLDSEVFQSSYYEKLHNWMSDRVGTFYTPEKTIKLFAKIESNLSLFAIAGFNRPYFADSSQVCIFKKYELLVNFLLGDKQLLQLSFTDLFLGRTRIVKAFQMLQQQDDFDIQQYTRHYGHIFLYLNQFQDPKFSSKVYDVLNKFNLVVIECNTQQQEINGLFNELQKVIASSNNKKIIFITTGTDNALAERFKTTDKYKSEFDTSDFGDLTTGSKRELLEKNITFQGEEISLKKLYFNLYDNDQPSVEQLNRLVIDTKTLVQLITDPEIKISNEDIGKSHLEGSYSKLFVKVKKDVLVEILQKSANISEKSKRFFVISGLDKHKQDMVDTLIKNLIGNTNDQHINKDLKDKISELQNSNKITLADHAFAEKDFKQLYHNNPDQHLYWIHLTKNNFILRGLFNPKFLPRKFAYPTKATRPIDIKTELLESNDGNIFYITGIETKEELINFLKSENQQENKKLSEICNSQNVRINKQGNNNEFSELVDKAKAQENKSVYWLDIKNNKISWHGVTRKNVDSDKDLISIIKNKSSILTDKPGMGKSTTLSILSKEMLKSHWVIFITLRDWQEKIAGLNESEKIDANSVVKFLSETNNLNHPLEKNLAQFLLETKYEGVSRPLLFVFDGFDEIRRYDTRNNNIGKDEFEKLLRFLKYKSQSTIWITAREHDAERLRETLSIFDIKFEPLHPTLQKQYFRDVWSNYLTLSYSQDELDQIFADENCQFQRYYQELSKGVNKILAMQDGDNDFMGIPLTLRLFAEGFQNKFKHFVDYKNQDFARDFENLSILNLYENFINEKFQIFIGEKTNLSSGFSNISAYWFKEKIIKLHCKLAFEELFGKEKANQLLGKKSPLKWQNYLDNKNSDLSPESLELFELFNIGIIRFITENHYEFLHRTLAEYFVSEMFSYELKSKNRHTVEKYQRFTSFIKKNILNDSDQVICQFLNAKSQEDTELNDIWEAIIAGLEYDRLLGNPIEKNNFIIDKTKNDAMKSLKFLREDVRVRVKWDSHSEFFKYTVLKNRGSITYKCYCVEELVNESIVTPDIKELEKTILFLSSLLDRSTFGYFNSELTPEQMILIINHYIFQSEQQRECFNLSLIERCFRQIVEVKGEKGKKIKENLDSFESVNRMFDGASNYTWLQNEGLYVIFQSQLLTHEIAQKFNFWLDQSKWQSAGESDYNIYIRDIFYKLIIPLLILKESSDSFKNVDIVALLDMFQAFASTSAELSLHERAVQSLLKCVQESLDRDKISEASLYISMQSLIVLKNWNMQISYKDNVLYLDYGETKDFHKPLKLDYEEKIVHLLRSVLADPDNLKIKCQKVASSILSRKDYNR